MPATYSNPKGEFHCPKCMRAFHYKEARCWTCGQQVVPSTVAPQEQVDADENQLVQRYDRMRIFMRDVADAERRAASRARLEQQLQADEKLQRGDRNAEPK